MEPTQQAQRLDDPFDSLLSLEDQYYTEGYNLGVADGSRAGRIEGRLLGLEKGFAKGLEMGRLSGQAVIWKARLPTSMENSRNSGAAANVQPLGGSDRLRKHVERLVELTDPESLETKNEEDAVNEFDERLAGAKAKATLISRIVGETDGSASPRRAEGGATSPSRESNEVEVMTTSPAQSKRPGTASRQTGEMEDFVGLPQLAKRATRS